MATLDQSSSGTTSLNMTLMKSRKPELSLRQETGAYIGVEIEGANAAHSSPSSPPQVKEARLLRTNSAAKFEW